MVDSPMTRQLPQLELPFRTYAPFSEPGTSREAADSVREAAAGMEATVLELLREIAPAGLTDAEIEARTGLGPNTARPRRIGLVLKGLVKDSGQRRLTPRGRQARVWVAA